MTRIAAIEPNKPMQSGGVVSLPLDRLGEALLSLSDTLCRPAWLETLLPDRWPVFSNPMQSLDKALSPLAEAAWAETQGRPPKDQSEKWPADPAALSASPVFPYQAASPTAGTATSATRRVQGLSMPSSSPDVSRAADPEFDGLLPAIPPRSRGANPPPGTPAIPGRNLRPGTPRSSAAPTSIQGGNGVEGEQKFRPVRRIDTPLAPIIDPAREAESPTAFTGARLATDPSRLAVVLQANLHARGKAVPLDFSTEAPEAGTASASPGAQPLTLQSTPHTPQPLPTLLGDEVDQLDDRITEPLDAARLEQMVAERLDRWLEEIELAYLRTYGTSGV